MSQSSKITELPVLQPYSPDVKWYAAKVFLNRSKSVSETLQKSGIEIYRQEVIPSLIFLHCDEETITRVNDTFHDKMHIYQNVAKTVHSYDIDPHSYDVDPLEEGRAFKEQSLFACKQAAA